MLRQIIESMSMVFVPKFKLNWVMAAGLAVSAASSYMGFKGSSKAEKAAQDAAEYQAALAKQNYKLQKESIAAQREEARHNATMAMRDTTVEAMRQRARVVAGAGESGVAGGSVTRSVVDTMYQEQDVRGRQLYQLESTLAQADRELRGAAIGFAGQSAPRQGTSNASMALASGLNFASSALSIYGDYTKSRTP